MDPKKLKVTVHPPLDFELPSEPHDLAEGEHRFDDRAGNILATRTFRFTDFAGGGGDYGVDDASGYCTSSGRWGVDGWIDHQSWWCKNYEMGIQFGRTVDGKFVALTGKFYGPKQQHCNGSRNHHEGSGRSDDVRENYPVITRARLWIRRS